MRRFNSPIQGLDTSGRSPFSLPGIIGLPPARMRAQDVRFVAGVATVNGVPLGQSNKAAQDYLINPPSVPNSKTDSQPSFNSQYYGDSGQFPVTLAAGIPQLVLKRPARTRVQLTIQNLNAIGVLAYNFDSAPAIVASINVAAGGNRVWDTAVPQGDLWLISAVAVNAVIEFINKDLTNPNT